MINEFLNNNKLITSIKPSFYYYDNRWNFPFGNDVGYIIIKRKLGYFIDDEIKKIIPKMENYLNDNNIPYNISIEEFEEIWNKVKMIS